MAEWRVAPLFELLDISDYYMPNGTILRQQQSGPFQQGGQYVGYVKLLDAAQQKFDDFALANGGQSKTEVLH